MAATDAEKDLLFRSERYPPINFAINADGTSESFDSIASFISVVGCTAYWKETPIFCDVLRPASLNINQIGRLGANFRIRARPPQYLPGQSRLRYNGNDKRPHHLVKHAARILIDGTDPSRLTLKSMPVHIFIADHQQLPNFIQTRYRIVDRD